MRDKTSGHTSAGIGVRPAFTPSLPGSAGLLPSFFVIGPPRTGTTWLDRVLRDHVLLPSTIKETRFFDKNFQYGMDWYRSHYKYGRNDRRIGEVAPTYFASPAARERIANVIPWARVVCIFRNPVERVLSLYRIKRAYGRIPWTFEQAMVRDPELLESSKYASNFCAWQNALGPDQVLGCVYDDLRKDPQSYVNRVADFVGIPRFMLAPSQVAAVESSDGLTHPRSYYRTRGATMMADWLKERRFGKLVSTIKNSPVRRFLLGGGSPFVELPLEFLQNLYERFRSEVEQLEILLNRDLSSWKSVSSAIADPASY